MLRLSTVFIFLVIGAAIFNKLETDGINETVSENKKTKMRSTIKIGKLRQDFAALLNVSINKTTFSKLVNDIRDIPNPSDLSMFAFIKGVQFSWRIVTTIGKALKFSSI